MVLVLIQGRLDRGHSSTPSSKMRGRVLEWRKASRATPPTTRLGDSGWGLRGFELEEHEVEVFALRGKHLLYRGRWQRVAVDIEEVVVSKVDHGVGGVGDGGTSSTTDGARY
jgi:hypothetical protein